MSNTMTMRVIVNANERKQYDRAIQKCVKVLPIAASGSVAVCHKRLVNRGHVNMLGVTN